MRFEINNIQHLMLITNRPKAISYKFIKNITSVLNIIQQKPPLYYLAICNDKMINDYFLYGRYSKLSTFIISKKRRCKLNLLTKVSKIGVANETIR